MKWDLYSLFDEGFLSCVNDYKTNIHSTDIPTTVKIHKALTFTRSFGKRYYDCEKYYMEEFIISKLVSNTNIHRRQWANRLNNPYLCQYEHFKIISHSCTTPETKLQKIPRFNGISCFEIYHLP